MAQQVFGIGRRKLLGWGGALAAAPFVLPSKLMAQVESKVFLNYTQEDLDRNYDQQPWAPNQSKISARNAMKRDLALEQLGEPTVLSYGSEEIEKLDLFRTERESAPIQVYIHGGAWRSGTARAQAHHAPKYVMAGSHFIALDFAPVTEVGLDGMIDQVRRAIAWVYNNAESFGGDRDRIFISGHSSGGHLGGVMTVTDWASLDVPGDVIKGAVLTSGMYDLHPVRLSARSTYVPFTDAIEQDFSAMRHLEKINCPIVIAYGEHDTDDFRRQSQEFANAIEKIGKLERLIVLEGANHFEVPESFSDPYGVIGYWSLRNMGLDPYKPIA